MSRKKTETNKYEISFLVSPLLTVEDANKLFETIKSTISKNEGQIISELLPAVLPLAYKISKVVNHKRSSFSESYFTAVQAEMSPEAAETVRAEIKKEEDILRFMFITLDKTAEPLSEAKRPTIKSRSENKTTDSEMAGVENNNEDETGPEVKTKEPEPINEEEIDKKIDDLVAEKAN